MNEAFRQFAQVTSRVVGNPWTFVAALAVIVVWAVTGPMFGFSDTWQLIINTGTTIVTFLMVFLIQNTQNRDATAIHLKLDELICAMKGARDSMVDLEDLSDEQLERLQREFVAMRERAGNAESREPDAIASELAERSGKNATSPSRRAGGKVTARTS